MKTAISLPDSLFERVEVFAKKLGISRSEFFATAARRYADELDDTELTEVIDAALAEAGHADSRFVRQAARDTFERELTDQQG